MIFIVRKIKSNLQMTNLRKYVVIIYTNLQWRRNRHRRVYNWNYDGIVFSLQAGVKEGLSKSHRAQLRVAIKRTNRNGRNTLWARAACVYIYYIALKHGRRWFMWFFYHLFMGVSRDNKRPLITFPASLRGRRHLHFAFGYIIRLERTAWKSDRVSRG